MARALQPSMVVLEDIDLVAEQRTQMGGGRMALLFELLNEIDGIGEDVDTFLRELVRRAALLAALDGAPALADAHFAEALRELEQGGRLTRSILGAGDGGAPPSPAAGGFPRPPRSC